MKNIERRKYLVRKTDVELETLRNLRDLILDAFSGASPSHIYKVKCADLSEYESTSPKFLEDSAELLQRKSVDHIYYKVHSPTFTFECSIEHGGKGSESKVIVESELEHLVDSYFTKINEFFRSIRRTDSLGERAAPFLFFILGVSAVLGLRLAYWLFKFSDIAPDHSVPVGAYILDPFFILIYSLVGILGVSFYYSGIEELFYPNTAILLGRERKSKTQLYRSVMAPTAVFVALTLVPGIYKRLTSTQGSSVNPAMEKVETVSFEDQLASTIKFDILPTQFVSAPGGQVEIGFSIENNFPDLLRNLTIQNSSPSGLTLEYDEMYIPIGFLGEGEKKNGSYKLKIQENIPEGNYLINVQLTGSTIDSTFKYGKLFRKKITIILQTPK